MMFDDNYFRPMCVFVHPILPQLKIKSEFMYIYIVRDNSFVYDFTIRYSSCILK